MRFNADQRALIRNRKLGFVFQSYHLLDDLTVYENLEVPLSYRDVKKSERQAIVADAELPRAASGAGASTSMPESQ